MADVSTNSVLMSAVAFQPPLTVTSPVHTARMELLRRCGGYCCCQSPDSVAFLSNCTQARHWGSHRASCTARYVRLVEASSLLSTSSWHVPRCITLRGHRKVHQKSTTLRPSARSLGTDIFRYILYFSVYQCTLCDGQQDARRHSFMPCFTAVSAAVLSSVVWKDGRRMIIFFTH